MRRRIAWIVIVLVAVGLGATVIVRRQVAPGDRVRLQLSGPVHVQFAGYYAAMERGFYKDEGVTIRILPAEARTISTEVVAARRAEIGVATLPALLLARNQGQPLVNVAQIFQYSGLRLVAFKESGMSGPRDLRGRKVGVWFGGNEVPLLATLEKYQIDRAKQITLVSQPANATFLQNRLVDAAMALTYREYGELRKASVATKTVTVVDFNREGTALLEDGLVAREDWIANPRRLELAGRFLKASLRGWEFCRDQPEECVAIVLKYGSNLNRSDQRQAMGSVNRLIWGPPAKQAAPGYMDSEAFAHSMSLLRRFGVIGKAATRTPYTLEVWTRATR